MQTNRLFFAGENNAAMEYRDDSAKGTDPETAKASGVSDSSSARGSAQFISDVEGRRAIKVTLGISLKTIP